jgi:hypothetical protein
MQNMTDRGRGKNKSSKIESSIDIKKKYQHMIHEGSEDSSPLEEVLSCEPEKFEAPTEIINIASPPNGSFQSEEMEENMKWEYEREPMFYNRRDSYEEEKKLIYTPDMSRIESNFISYDRNKSLQQTPVPDISKSFQNFLAKDYQPREIVKEVVKDSKHEEKEKQRGRNRSLGSVNRTGNFEAKRQEVLKRKERLETDRIEKLSKKIKEKEEKCERHKRNKRENRNVSKTFDKSSYSNRKEGYSRKTSRDNLPCSLSRSKEKIKVEENEEVITSPPTKQPNRYVHHHRYDSVEKDNSPSIVYPSTSKVGYSPETPDNYCPIINAHLKREWIGGLKTTDEITEFPLNIEENSEHEVESIKHKHSRKSSISNSSIIRREVKKPETLNKSRSKETLNKSRSKDILGYKEIHGNTSIVKAFKNTP